MMRLTITVPDQVAERLAQEKDVSAYITRLVLGGVNGREVHRRHREAGFDIPESEIEHAKAEHQRLMADITPELRAEAEDFAAKLRARDPEVLFGMPSSRGRQA